MTRFMYWADLPLKLQMKVLKRAGADDLVRCRGTCKAMEQMVMNREFQKKFANRQARPYNIPNPRAVRYQSPPPQPGTPPMEDTPTPRVMAMPVFEAPAPQRLTPAPATSSNHRVGRKRKADGEKQNHLMQFWRPPNYHTDREMYNRFYQSIFGSTEPIEVINLSDSDED